MPFDLSWKQTLPSTNKVVEMQVDQLEIGLYVTLGEIAECSIPPDCGTAKMMSRPPAHQLEILSVGIYIVLDLGSND